MASWRLAGPWHRTTTSPWVSIKTHVSLAAPSCPFSSGLTAPSFDDSASSHSVSGRGRRQTGPLRLPLFGGGAIDTPPADRQATWEATPKPGDGYVVSD